MNIALLLVIEHSEYNLGEGTNKLAYQGRQSEPLEEEAIECVRAWRQFFPVMPIYCMCPSWRVPKSETIEVLTELEATYIEHRLRETDDFKCGYWNVPAACAWMEKHIDSEYFVHIDLDMKLIRDPSKYFESIDYTKIGVLHNLKKHQIVNEPMFNFESNFIITQRKLQFFQHWYEELLFAYSLWPSAKGKLYAELEEFAIDKMFHPPEANDDKLIALHAMFPISVMKYYQIGPRYKVEDIPDKDLDNVVFIHRHEYESNEEYGKYLRRMKKWQNQ